MDLLKWMATHDSLGVGEARLQKLMLAEGLIGDVEADEHLSYEDALAMSLVCKKLPDVAPSELEQALRTRRAITDGSMGEDPWQFVSCEDLEEVVSLSEKKLLRQKKQDADKQVEKRRSVQVGIKAAVCKRFKIKVIPAAKELVGQKPLVGKAADRWWSTVAGDASFIEQWMPPGSRVFTDHWNGRFRVSLRHHAARSVSWTSRGMQAASLQALRLLWGWQHADKGEHCPIPLDVTV